MKYTRRYFVWLLDDKRKNETASPTAAIRFNSLSENIFELFADSACHMDLLHRFSLSYD